MPSSFNWVDFAEDDRRKMMEILYLFRDREIREELGIGTVRDAFSDILFPGGRAGSARYWNAFREKG